VPERVPTSPLTDRAVLLRFSEARLGRCTTAASSRRFVDIEFCGCFIYVLLHDRAGNAEIPLRARGTVHCLRASERAGRQPSEQKPCMCTHGGGGGAAGARFHRVPTAAAVWTQRLFP
jgi:hypothetical protein